MERFAFDQQIVRMAEKKEYRSALITAAVTGKVDVRGVSDFIGRVDSEHARRL